MPELSKFDPPAFQNEFEEGEQALKEKFEAHWNDNIRRYTLQTQQNDPWSSVNQPALTEYFNPLTTGVPEDTMPAVIRWTAFPRRIKTTYPNVGQRKQWQYADEGPADPNYRPQGPRGWQDEYCEWSVTRNKDGKITRVAFTCENREYWYTLWETSPEVVLRVYKEIVGDHVQLEDLYMRDTNGKVVENPETGRPAYNDRNKWNSTTTHGAVHLISNPNSLSAEIFLAGQATILREDAQGQPITNKNQLINCSRYGTPNRNSDPTIGSDVNNLVRGPGGPGTGLQISLHNPVGLYIQSPDFNTYQLPFTAPADASPADYWKVIRGRVRQGGETMDMILHAVYEVPDEQGFTVSDITIDGFNIDFGSQITETFQVGLAGTGIPQEGPAPSALSCAGSSPNPLPRPYVLSYLNALNAAFRSSLNLRVEPGMTANNVALYAFDADQNADITLSDGNAISIQRKGVRPVQGGLIYLLDLIVPETAELGDVSLQLTNANGDQGPAVYGMLTIVPKGTLSSSPAPELSEHEPVSVTSERPMGASAR